MDPKKTGGQKIKESPKGKIKVVDANELDKKVPRNLIIKYGDNHYILKAGLEWKAMLLYGGGNYSLVTEIIDRQPDNVLAKATFSTFDKNGNPVFYTNFGEASKQNVAPHMLKYLLHLALTRAECRVLRMATACGYASYEEMDTSKGKEAPQLEDGGKPATAQQLQTIKTLKGDVERNYTKQEAAEAISILAEQNHETAK